MSNRRRLSHRSSRALSTTLFCFLPLGIALSCGDTDDAVPPQPPGPIGVAIDELRPRGDDTWRSGDPEPVVVGCDRRLGVTVVLYDPEASSGGAGNDKQPGGDWLLRPPGACGRSQCGTVAVSVQPLDGGPAATGEAALETVMVDLGPLGAALDGRVRIRAELRENGRELAVKDGVPLADELEVTLSSDVCPPGGEAGAGGAPSGTGGTGGTAGTAGSGTGGTAGTAGSGNPGGQAGQGGAGAPGTGGTAGATAGSGGAPGGEGGGGGA